MYQPESLQTNYLDWFLAQQSADKSRKVKRFTVDARPQEMTLEELRTALIPQGLSANKRAVAEALISSWIASTPS
jgi:hypothetical protein